MGDGWIIALRAAGDVAMPRECVACGTPLGRHEEHLCLSCAADLPLTDNWKRTHHPMADRFNEIIERHRGEAPAPYAYAAALLHYRSGYRNIPRALKYRYGLSEGRFFARMLGRRLAAAPHFSDINLVLPVPLHWTRRFLRGYNQAEVIAREVAACLGVPVCTGLLVRARRTRSQALLKGEEKARNVASAFRVRSGRSHSAGAASALAGARHILLVDDTFTTGATLHACYQALRAVTDARISVATLAAVGT